MENLTDVGVVRSLLDRYGFRFSKALGQNFLINPTVCPRMAEASGVGPASGVLEIGPGIGVLTRELATRAGKVVAVELDQRLLPVLEETLRDAGRVKVVHGDVMKLDLAALLKEEFRDMPVAVCANLPYYITSPIIMGLLESRLPFTTITVLVQKEAAQRLSRPSPRTYRPIPAHHTIYNRLYQEYKQLHDYFGRGGNDVMLTLRELSRTNG